MTNLYAPIFTRAALQVALVACNVVNIARGNYVWALATGTAISWVWWRNSRTAAHSDVRWAQWAYAAGAGTGTVIGMLVGQWL